MAKKKTEALAVIEDSAFPMLADNAIQRVGGLLTNFNRFELLQLKVPLGGGKLWELPSLSGEAEGAATVDVIIAEIHAKQKKYWVEQDDVSGAPPDCSSPDSVTGYGTPGGSCDACPHNQFDDGGGKACHDFWTMYVFMEGGRVPLLLSVPERSTKNAKKYLMELMNRDAEPHGVVTTLGLEPAVNNQGKPYSKITFKSGAALTGEMAARSAAMAELMAGYEAAQTDAVILRAPRAASSEE